MGTLKLAYAYVFSLFIAVALCGGKDFIGGGIAKNLHVGDLLDVKDRFGFGADSGLLPDKKHGPHKAGDGHTQHKGKDEEETCDTGGKKDFIGGGIAKGLHVGDLLDVKDRFGFGVDSGLLPDKKHGPHKAGDGHTQYEGEDEGETYDTGGDDRLAYDEETGDSEDDDEDDDEDETQGDETDETEGDETDETEGDDRLAQIPDDDKESYRKKCNFLRGINFDDLFKFDIKVKFDDLFHLDVNESLFGFIKHCYKRKTMPRNHNKAFKRCIRNHKKSGRSKVQDDTYDAYDEQTNDNED